MQKRILIVCDAFPPAFAPRVGYLCKFISDTFDITVVTEDFENDTWQIDINREKIRLLKFDFSQETKSISGKIKSAIQQLSNYFFCRKDRIVAHKVIKQIGNEHFDLVFCSSYFQFPLLCAKKLAKHFNVPLCIDLRDIVEQYNLPSGLKTIPFFFKLRWLTKIQRNIILKKADAITTVSKWHQQTLSRYNPNTSIIYNGYDDLLFKYEAVNSDKFRIVYTGRLLNLEMRNPELMFLSINNLIQQGKFDKSKISIDFYTNEQSKTVLEKFASSFPLAKETLHFHQLVKMNTIPQIILQSSIVLILTNKATNKGPHGIMTTKFFEAVGCEKPILCVQSDEECLAEAIYESKAGLSAKNVTEVSNYLLEKYNEWENTGTTHQSINQAVKKSYTRQHQAKQFTDLFNNLIAKHNI